MLEARGVTLGYPGTPPLIEGLDLALGRGELAALTGPNGTGKSTLCLALAGLVVPQLGAVTVDGEPCLPASPARARVAMLFQDPDSQLVTTSVEAEVAFPLENLGWTPDRVSARVARLLAEFDLEGLRGRAPERLSGGEKSRLALASALAAEPGYLILDEPGVYLDAAARLRLREFLARERARGLGILWVTQLAEEWEEAGRRLALEGRRLRAAGPGELQAAGPDELQRAEPVLELGRSSDPDAGPAWAGAPQPSRIAARGVSFSYPAAPAPAWVPRADATGGGRPREGKPGARPVLAGLDLEVRAGETVLIGGASGSGKTTLLLLLAGVLDPEHGSIALEPGRRPGSESRTTPPLGVSLQSPEDQLVCPTVLEDVALGLRLAGRGKADAEAAAARALAAAGLDPASVGPLPPAGLSHGQRRRAAWAGIWALGAGIWMLDEPTAGLDQEGVSALQTAVREFTIRGGTAILVTQDPRLSGWAARRLLLAGGRLTSPSEASPAGSGEGARGPSEISSPSPRGPLFA